MTKLNAGITLPGEGDGGTVWNILGQVYFMKELCDSSCSLRAGLTQNSAFTSRSPALA